MKALIVGTGSIGMRHAHNLKKLGVEEMIVVELDDARAEQAVHELKAKSVPDMGDALEKSLDIAVIASPNHLHLQQAKQCIERGISTLVEKPLSHSPDGLSELAILTLNNGVTSLVGCNMRFHPAIQVLRNWLDEGRIGRLLFGRYHVGSYLPEWRPNSDYKTSYSAREEMGGGCILDCIHELDLAISFQGVVKDVSAVAESIGPLGIDVETSATLLCRHQNGTLSDVHFDYLHRHYQRGFELVGEEGTLVFDDALGEAKLIAAGGDIIDSFTVGKDWDYNEMYLAEMEHFLQSAIEHTPTVLPVHDAVHVTQVALAGKQAAKDGKRILVEDFAV